MRNLDFLLALVLAITSALSTYIVCAYDPNPLQDFCVAINYDPKQDDDQAVFVNGRFCKNPKLVRSDDFFYSGLDEPANTNNPLGSNVTTVNVDKIPGLNTLGVSLNRYDFAPYGVNPPHYHPRGSEIFWVIKGTVYMAFVSSNQDGNRLFGKILKEGDVFAVPIGMIHFEYNCIRDKPAVAYSVINSQNPGAVLVPNTVFGSNPPIFTEILVEAFQLNKGVIAYLQSRVWTKNFT